MADLSLAAILGRLPSGVFVLTVRHDGEETGMLASWVQQAGFEPPMITTVVRQDRYVAQWISDGEPFALNVVREHQRQVLRHFARGFAQGEPAFEGLNVARTERGLPILLDTLGYLECEAAGSIDSGDHRVFLARVVSGRLADDGAPMIHVRKHGLHY